MTTDNKCTCGGETFAIREHRSYGKFNSEHQWEQHGTLADKVQPARYCPKCDLTIVSAAACQQQTA